MENWKVNVIVILIMTAITGVCGFAVQHLPFYDGIGKEIATPKCNDFKYGDKIILQDEFYGEVHYTIIDRSKTKVSGCHSYTIQSGSSGIPRQIVNGLDLLYMIYNGNGNVYRKE